MAEAKLNANKYFRRELDTGGRDYSWEYPQGPVSFLPKLLKIE